MIARVGRLRGYGAMLRNAGALVGTTLVTSGLGFVYWWLAARLFTPVQVGFVSAAIAAANLLSFVAVFGLGTVLIGELARAPERRAELLTTALLAVTGVAMLLAAGFLLATPLISAELVPLATSALGAAGFVAAVVFSTHALIVDQACVGLLRGDLQLARNTLASVVKLLLLGGPLLLAAGHAGVLLTALWGASAGLSLLVALPLLLRGGGRLRPAWGALRRIGRLALAHHVLDLALGAPVLLLPLIVAATLSVEATAYFYVPWMIASLLFAVPTALSAVLHAVAAAQVEQLAAKLRFTLGASLLVNLGGCLTLMLLARPILGLFGAEYAESSAVVLAVLALSALPAIVRVHYVAVSRVFNRTRPATLYALVEGALVLGLAFLGARAGGLVGLSLGWLAAISLGALITGTTIYRAARPRPQGATPATAAALGPRANTGRNDMLATQDRLIPRRSAEAAGLLTLTSWPAWLLGGHLALVVGAELLAALADPRYGMLAYGLLLALLVGYRAWTPRDVEQRLTLALLLPPLLRLVTLAMPLDALPRAAWPAAVAAPMLVAVWLTVRRGGFSREALGLRAGNLAVQLGIAAVGPLLGAVAYLVLPQPAMAETLSLGALWLPALSVLLLAGCMEELIFRGVLQAALLPAVGRWGLVYGAALFAALQIGPLSAAYAGLMFVCGLLFAAAAYRSGSILGVALAHGAAGATYLIGMPLLMGGAAPPLSDLPALFVVGLLVLGALPGLLAVAATAKAPRPDAPRGVGARLRDARVETGLSYVALSLQTGIPVRQLAELEHGLRPARPEHVARIATVLGVTV